MPEPVTIGRFRVVARLSSQPASVCHVVDPRNAQRRALHAIAVPDQAWADILRRELAALIQQPIAGVVTIYEFELEESSAYIVTELLQERLTPTSSFDRVEALTLVSDYCRAVAEVRARAITCLAVLPSNLWRTADATVKIGDFSEAPVRSSTTRTGMAIDPDQVAYMAPELVKGLVTTPNEASDTFAAGVFLYQLVTHRRPFAGDTPIDYLTAVASGRRERPPAFDEPADRGLMALIEQMLADDPRRRPTHLDMLAKDLDELVRERASSTGTPGTPAATAPGPEPVFDEHVQFTVYRPRRVAPHEWAPLLVFAHLSERRGDSPDDPDPLEEVQRQADAILGNTSHSPQRMDSSQAVPRQGEITFIPQAAGVEFDPPARRFRWLNPVHREEFLLRIGDGREGTVIRGRVTAYLGAIILAEIPLTLTIGRTATTPSAELVAQSSRPYRKIFASYSHRDRAVVEEFSAYAKAIGDRFQMDVIDLRSGERWEPALEGLIREADVFQLFWSWNALESPYVQREWEYALQLARPSFVRPVYWDDPLPRRGSLPPAALLDLHFESITPRIVTSPPVAAAAPPAPASIPAPMPGPAATPPATASVPPSPAASPRARSWRIYATAAAVLFAMAAIPTLYVGMQPAAIPPVSSQPQSTTAAASLTVVVRSDDGQLRANTDVELIEPGSGRVIGTARTNDTGRAVFHDLKVDAYEIRAKTAAATPQRVTVTKAPLVVDMVIRP